uniref:Gem (nuclear organelle) associated protein 2 n=1 Tax=Eptatretus burgeri TaxID=7764 RepID=A0A8C4NHH2_EPTBU
MWRRGAKEDDLHSQALPVENANLGEPFDPLVPPQTPQEYLRRVQVEASHCPDVVVAEIDPKKLKSKTQAVVSSPCGCIPAPNGMAPDLQLQRKQIAAFSSLRQQLFVLHFQPECEDEQGWRLFCLGQKHCQKQNEQTDLKEDVIETSQYGVDYAKVISSHFCIFKSSPILKFLDDGWQKEFMLGCWLFALLTCLEKPLLPEAHALLRQLARACAALRASLVRIPFLSSSQFSFFMLLQPKAKALCFQIAWLFIRPLSRFFFCFQDKCEPLKDSNKA